MAINLNDKFPANTTAPDADYPYGGARNTTVIGDGTGTPWDADILNDAIGLYQALLTEAGITPSGLAETATTSQYLLSMKAILRANGVTGSRPTLTTSEEDKGYVYFDETLTKPIWWSGTIWVDSTGTPV